MSISGYFIYRDLMTMQHTSIEEKFTKLITVKLDHLYPVVQYPPLFKLRGTFRPYFRQMEQTQVL